MPLMGLSGGGICRWAPPAGQAAGPGRGEGVVAQLEALAVEHAREVGVAHDLRADLKEGGGHVLEVQYGGDLGGPFGAGAIVEGERDAPAGGGLVGDEAAAAVGDEHGVLPGERRAGAVA